MKAVKQTVRKYYKYQYSTYVQPTPTSNGRMGQGDFACDQSYWSSAYGGPAYYAFSGRLWSTRQEDNTTGLPPQWISWYTKNPIKLTSFTFQQPGEYWYYYIGAGTVQGSNDNSTWVDIGTIGNCYSQSTVTVTINSNTPYNYHRIYITNAPYYGAYYGMWMQNIRLNAQERIVVESTAQDYDFYKDVDVYKVPTTTVRHYYKYVYTDATSPAFASENQAVSGINNFKMTTTTSYWYITGNSTNTFTNGNTLTFDIGENNKNIKSIGYIGVVSPGNYPGTVLENIQCSEDNQNWITISSRFGQRGDYKTNPLQITTPNNYRYIRFTTACDDSNFSRGGAYGLQIKYDVRGYQESTSSDYDFYIDKNTYYGVSKQ